MELSHGSNTTMCFVQSQDAGLYLKDLIPPVLSCFYDQDSRVRYYACEALYNISKVARGSVLPFFNDIFDGLSKVSKLSLGKHHLTFEGGVGRFWKKFLQHRKARKKFMLDCLFVYLFATSNIYNEYIIKQLKGFMVARKLTL